LTLAFAQLWHVFNMRDPGTYLFRNEITRNPYVWAALALCFVLILCAIYLPGLSLILGLHPPGADGWWLAMTFSFMPWLLGQISKVTAGRRLSPTPPE
jgi:Ca2+-transporting ATPase